MNNWFETLSDALDAEGVLDLWDNSPLRYGETRTIRADDGSKYGRVISVYRHDVTGRYERVITYQC